MQQLMLTRYVMIISAGEKEEQKNQSPRDKAMKAVFKT